MKAQEEIQDEIDTLPKLQITGARIPVCIAEAVLAVQMSLGTLGKEDRNQFQNYNFVSIDKYYEVVARAATQQGLSWFCQETSSEIVNFGEGKGAIRFEFAFTMFHISGQVVPVYDRISIYHPLQGAQTSGSAASYAEKLFMRKAFKVVTGEDDADAVDQSFSLDETFDQDTKNNPEPEGGESSPGNTQRSPEPEKEPEKETVVAESEGATAPGDPPEEEAPVSSDITPTDYIEDMDLGKEGEVAVLREIKDAASTDWGIVYQVFEEFMPQEVGLTKKFWTENTKAIELLKEYDPKLHKKLVQMFTDNQIKITTKGK